jgi:hypothetical protein
MRFSKASFVAGAAAALVLGSGTAFAATGGKFILGKPNAATTVTTLTNNYGSALTLNSKAGQPSLRVNRNVKVPNLNSDLLDGLDQSAFARSAMRTGSFFGAGSTGSSPDEIIAVASCPNGTVVTGGGFSDSSLTGFVSYNGPFGGNTWGVVGYVDETVDTDPTVFEAYATCLNATGPVAGGFSREAILERSREAAARR